jgi:glycosyltransferase involved in cell wall biosynthesis
VISILDLQYRQFPHDFPPLARLALQILVPWTARRAAGILTLSEFARRQILDGLQLPPARVTVTPLAADPTFGAPIAPEERHRRLAGLLPDATPYLLCVANTYPHKNVPALVEAFARVQDRFPHRLVLVGIAGRDERVVRDRLQRLACRDRVLRLHHLSHDQMVALYQGADAFVFPSLYEGFGLPVLEALQAGVPLVASDAGPIPEVAGPGTTCVPGTADALADAVARVLVLTPQERQARVVVGRRHAATFTWEKTAAATLAALERAARAD